MGACKKHEDRWATSLRNTSTNVNDNTYKLSDAAPSWFIRCSRIQKSGASSSPRASLTMPSPSSWNRKALLTDLHKTPAILFLRGHFFFAGVYQSGRLVAFSIKPATSIRGLQEEDALRQSEGKCKPFTSSWLMACRMHVKKLQYAADNWDVGRRLTENIKEAEDSIEKDCEIVPPGLPRWSCWQEPAGTTSSRLPRKANCRRGH